MIVRRRIAGAVAALALTPGLLLAGCSGDDAEPDAAPAGDGSGEAVESGDGEAATTLQVFPIREVRFPTSDGIELAGTVRGDGPIGIVLAHMRGRDRSTWTAFAEEAAAAGHRVLAFDFRGYGESPGERDTALDLDLLAAIDMLRVDGVERTVVIGASMGATAAINIAAQVDLAGVVALSPPATFEGLAAGSQAVNVGEPMLLVAAEGDEPYVSDVRAMHEVAPDSTLEILGGAAHGTGLFDEHRDRLTTLLLEFVAARSPA